MMDSGQMTRPMDSVSTLMSMAPCTEGSGKMTYNTVWAWKHGWTAVGTKDTTPLEGNMALVPISGTMEADIKENGLRTRSSELASTPGLTADHTKDNGRTTTWKAWASTCGTTVDHIQASTWTTRNTALGSTDGKTEDSTKATGTTASSMDLVFMQFHPKSGRNMDSGKKASELNGLVKTVNRR